MAYISHAALPLIFVQCLLLPTPTNKFDQRGFPAPHLWLPAMELVAVVAAVVVAVVIVDAVIVAVVVFFFHVFVLPYFHCLVVF